jgi:spore coat protein U-like protein
MKKVIVILMALAMILAVSGLASALTQTANLNVSLRVGAECTVSTTAIDFGSQEPVYPKDGQGDVTVTCATGVPYNIALDAGTNYDGFFRRVSNGGVAPDFVLYRLFKTVYPEIEEWGDSDVGNSYPGASSLADTGNGIAQPHTVYGLISPNEGEPPGTYVDIVLVTVHY